MNNTQNCCLPLTGKVIDESQIVPRVKNKDQRTCCSWEGRGVALRHSGDGLYHVITDPFKYIFGWGLGLSKECPNLWGKNIVKRVVDTALTVLAAEIAAIAMIVFGLLGAIYPGFMRFGFYVQGKGMVTEPAPLSEEIAEIAKAAQERQAAAAQKTEPQILIPSPSDSPVSISSPRESLSTSVISVDLEEADPGQAPKAEKGAVSTAVVLPAATAAAASTVVVPSATAATSTTTSAAPVAPAPSGSVFRYLNPGNWFSSPTTQPAAATKP